MIRAVLLLLAGCTSPEQVELTVLAASSLTDAFGALEARFEAAHPGVDVVVSFGGSQALATRIRHGLRADVFASADEAHVQALADEGLVGSPRPFARNTLVLAVAEGIEGSPTIEDLPRLERVVLGGDDVPLGRYTEYLLDAAGRRFGDAWRAAVADRVVSREPNARLVAAKVALGEADAAVVYATDAVGVRAVPLPDGLGPPVSYHHAPLAQGSPLAAEWMDFVESPDGQLVLSAHGFATSP